MAPDGEVHAGDFRLRETCQPPLKDQYDEWLARVICYAFSVPASAFVSQVNRATSETLRQQATTEGLAPLKAWVKMVLDRVLSVCFSSGDCEFFWVGDDAVDPLQQAQTIAILVGAGVKTIAEARAELGLGGGAGVAKFNPYHDEQGRFTDAEGAVEPREGDRKEPDQGGAASADAQYRPIQQNVRYRPQSATDHVIRHHLHEVPKGAVTFKSGDGHSFFAPPNADFTQVFAVASAEGLLGVIPNVGGGENLTSSGRVIR